MAARIKEVQGGNFEWVRMLRRFPEIEGGVRRERVCAMVTIGCQQATRRQGVGQDEIRYLTCEAGHCCLPRDEAQV